MIIHPKQAAAVRDKLVKEAVQVLIVFGYERGLDGFDLCDVAERALDWIADLNADMIAPTAEEIWKSWDGASETGACPPSAGKGG